MTDIFDNESDSEFEINNNDQKQAAEKKIGQHTQDAILSNKISIFI